MDRIVPARVDNSRKTTSNLHVIRGTRLDVIGPIRSIGPV